MATTASNAISPTAVAASRGYRVEIAERVADLNTADWDAVCSDCTDLYMDRRFVESVESSRLPEWKVWSALVYDGEQPVAACCFLLMPVDASLLSDEQTKRWTNRVRWVLPRFLKFKILFCGLPVSASQSHLHFAPSADRAEALRAIDRQMRAIAREHRTRILVFKEFTAAEREDLGELERLGYLRGASTVISDLECDFASFDEYGAGIRSRYRYDIVRSQKKFVAVGMRWEILTGTVAAERYTDGVHRLYEQVVARSHTQLEILPAEFFRELLRRFGEDAYLILALRGDEVIGFATGLKTRPWGSPLFVGLDYERNAEGDVYFNLFFQLLEQILSHGVSGIHFGANSEEYKAKLGCTQQLNYTFVAATNWLNRPLRWFADSIFPPLKLHAPLNVLRGATETNSGDAKAGAARQKPAVVDP